MNPDMAADNAGMELAPFGGATSAGLRAAELPTRPLWAKQSRAGGNGRPTGRSGNSHLTEESDCARPSRFARGRSGTIARPRPLGYRTWRAQSGRGETTVDRSRSPTRLERVEPGRCAYVRKGSGQASSTVVGQLPRIDDHATIVDAAVTEAWAAVLDELDGATSGPLATTYARVIGCKPSRPSGTRPLKVGSTVPGFAVISAVAKEELVLTGHHAFSTYELIFRLRSTGKDRTEIRAESRAAFPAVHGRLYRLLVIGTGFHVLAVRRLLGSIRQRAEELSRGHTV